MPIRLHCPARGLSLAGLIALASLSIVLSGCTGGPHLPSRDPALRKTPMQFAADAAVRHPYPADAPRGGELDGRAQVGYMLNRIDLINFSEQTWSDLEVWINQQYVIYLPEMEPRDLKMLNFQSIYDNAGNHFPARNVLVSEVEVLMNGTLYEIPFRVAD